MRTMLFLLLSGIAAAQAPVSTAQPPRVVRKSVQTTGGQTIEGQVLNESPQDLQLRTDDKKIEIGRAHV